MTLNFLRWAIAFVLLLPFAAGAAPRQPAVAALAALRRARVAGRGLLQRAAVPRGEDVDADQRDAGRLQHAGVHAGVGRCLLRPAHHARAAAGRGAVDRGVLVVLAHGDLQHLARCASCRATCYMLLATAAWAVYSWLLTRPGDPAEIRADWAAFLMAQLVPGVGWSISSSAVSKSISNVPKPACGALGDEAVAGAMSAAAGAVGEHHHARRVLRDRKRPVEFGGPARTRTGCSAGGPIVCTFMVDTPGVHMTGTGRRGCSAVTADRRAPPRRLAASRRPNPLAAPPPVVAGRARAAPMVPSTQASGDVGSART